MKFSKLGLLFAGAYVTLCVVVILCFLQFFDEIINGWWLVLPIFPWNFVLNLFAPIETPVGGLLMLAPLPLNLVLYYFVGYLIESRWIRRNKSTN